MVPAPDPTAASPPAPPAPGERPPEDDRTRLIVAAAYDLLEEAGLDGLTIRGVLKRTGLSRRAVYERFGGKDDLVLAAFARTIAQAAEYFGARTAAIEDPIAQLHVIVSGIVRGRSVAVGGRASGGDRIGTAMSREHLRLAESRPDDLEAALHPLMALIARILSDGMAAGVVRRGPPERLAALVYNLVSTTLHKEMLTGHRQQIPPISQIELADEIWQFCHRAIIA